MYKITLFDCDLVSWCSGVERYFTDSLEEFEKHWMLLADDEEEKNRFLRSKQGEIVTDYYSDSPDLNIVQMDEKAQILKERQLDFENWKFKLANAYEWESQYFVKKAIFDIRYIKFQDEYYCVGKYRLEGVCRKHEDYENRWSECYCFGNPVLLKTCKKQERERWQVPGKDFYRSDFEREEFAEDIMEAYCWIVIRRIEADKLAKVMEEEITEELLTRLMRDIPGEGG